MNWEKALGLDDIKTRKIKNGVPFAWADKRVLRYIRKELKRQNNKSISSILLTYYALVEIASNIGKESFTCSQAQIAELATLHINTVGPAINKLSELGVIFVLKKASELSIKLKLTPDYWLIDFDDIDQQ
ncbi:hypothetical protein HQ531_05795 [bacterium]|nr:hypothetical protein [bacterium]